MKNLKKIFCLFLSLCLLAGMLPAAFAEDAENGDFADALAGVLDDSPKVECHTILGDSVAAAFGTQEYSESAEAAHTPGSNWFEYVYDDIIPESCSYGALVSKELGIGKTNMCAHCGWRTVDFVNAVTWMERHKCREDSYEGSMSGFRISTGMSIMTASAGREIISTALRRPSPML